MEKRDGRGSRKTFQVSISPISSSAGVSSMINGKDLLHHTNLPVLSAALGSIFEWTLGLYSDSNMSLIGFSFFYKSTEPMTNEAKVDQGSRWAPSHVTLQLPPYLSYLQLSRASHSLSKGKPMRPIHQALYFLILLAIAPLPSCLLEACGNSALNLQFLAFPACRCGQFGWGGEVWNCLFKLAIVCFKMSGG